MGGEGGLVQYKYRKHKGSTQLEETQVPPQRRPKLRVCIRVANYRKHTAYGFMLLTGKSYMGKVQG